MALKTRQECIKTYCGEAAYKIKEIQKEMDEFDGYNSLEFMEMKIDRAIEDLTIAKENIMKAYDEIEE